MKDQTSFNRPMITPILELVCVDQLSRFKWKLFQLSKKKSRFLHKQALNPIAAIFGLLITMVLHAKQHCVFHIYYISRKELVCSARIHVHDDALPPQEKRKLEVDFGVQ